MTIEFSLPIFDRQPRDRFVVLIERDGTMAVPGHDFEQDDMLTFMTGQESNPRKLLREWEGTPSQRIKALGDMLGLKPKVIRSVAADWVEHVFDAIQPLDDSAIDNVGDVKKRLAAAMKLIRRSIQHNSPTMGTDRFLIEAHEIAGELLSIAEDYDDISKGDTFWSVADSLRWLSYGYGGHWRAKADLHFEWGAWLLRITKGTWKARAFSHSDDTGTTEWEQGHVDESEWQIRRFYDVVWAIKHKKPRPSIQETP